MKILHHFKSPNFNRLEDKREVKYIILHYTEVPVENALHILRSPEKMVSTHYLLSKNGDIYNLVDENDIAWHAGVSYWKDDVAINNGSIGIELENLGDEQFEEKLIMNTIELCTDIIKRHNIKKENILGHSDVAINRKIDPGIFFPWDKLAEYDLCIWPFLFYKNNINHTEIKEYQFITQEIQYNLLRFGYKIDITKVMDNQTSDAIRSFTARFASWKIKSIDNYRNMNTLYFWDNDLEQIIKELINI